MWRRSFTLAVICLSACSAREPLGAAASSAGASGAAADRPQGGPVAGGSGGASGESERSSPFASGDGPQALPAGGGGASPGAGLVTLAVRQMSPYSLAIDGTSVYWGNNGAQNPGDTSVAKVPLGGGAVTVLVSGVTGVGGLVVDSSRVYFSGEAPSGSGLLSVPLDGGVVSLVATGFVNDPIAIGRLGVYGSSISNVLLEAPFGGGAAVAITPMGALGASDETYGIAVDAHSIYWTLFMDPTTVLKAPIEGGAPTTLTSAPGAGGSIAVDDTWVYFGTGQGLMKVSVIGGAATTLSPSPAGGIAVDDAYVYFTSNAAVMKMAKAGGGPIAIATDQVSPGAIAVDATSVYWANNGPSMPGAAGIGGSAAAAAAWAHSGTIMKLTPK